MQKRPIQEYLNLKDDEFDLETAQLKGSNPEEYDDILNVRKMFKAKSDEAVKAQADAEKAQALNLALNKEICELKLRQDLTASTPIACYNYLISKFSVGQNNGLSWPKPSLEEIRKAWNSVKSRDLEHFVPTDVKTLLNEDQDVHPVFLKLIKTISSCLSGRTNANISLNSHLRPNLRGPNLVPNIVITRTGIYYCSWFSSICLIELKKSGVDIGYAVGDCTNYCCIAQSKMPSTDECGFRLGIACNMDSIMLLYIPKSILDIKRSDVFELFPRDWITLDEPTAGFEALCHALALPLPSKIAISVENIATREEKDYIVRDTLYRNGEISIHVIQLDDDGMVAVKVAHGKYAKGIITEFERHNFEAISKIQGIAPYILRFRPDLNVVAPRGFAMECADESLTSWIQRICPKNNNSSSPESDLVFKSHLKEAFLNILQGLKLLHDNGWFHMDLRPANIVIRNGTARLIDWATAINKSHPKHIPSFYQGHNDHFWPDPYLAKAISDSEDKAKWDLIGFGFIISFLCLSKDYREIVFAMSDSRTKALETYCNDHPEQTMVRAGFEIVKHCSSIGDKTDYAYIEHLISHA